MSTTDKKSGYQLRTELLGMAIGILESRTERLEQNEHFMAAGDSTYKRHKVLPYETEDVLLIAEKLYEFVQTK